MAENTTSQGKTALQMAEERGLTDIANLLKAAEAENALKANEAQKPDVNKNPGVGSWAAGDTKALADAIDRANEGKPDVNKFAAEHEVVSPDKKPEDKPSLVAKLLKRGRE